MVGARRGRSGRSLWGGGISPGPQPCAMAWAKLLGPWGPGTLSIQTAQQGLLRTQIHASTDSHPGTHVLARDTQSIQRQVAPSQAMPPISAHASQPRTRGSAQDTSPPGRRRCPGRCPGRCGPGGRSCGAAPPGEPGPAAAAAPPSVRDWRQRRRQQSHGGAGGGARAAREEDGNRDRDRGRGRGGGAGGGGAGPAAAAEVNDGDRGRGRDRGRDQDGDGDGDGDRDRGRDEDRDRGWQGPVGAGRGAGPARPSPPSRGSFQPAAEIQGTTVLHDTISDRPVPLPGEAP